MQAFAAARRLRAEIGIEHDPDDALVAAARAALEQRLGATVDDVAPAELELDAIVAGRRELLSRAVAGPVRTGPASRAFPREIEIVSRKKPSFAGFSVPDPYL